MRFGLDYLLGSNYGDLILREHPEGWAAGFILNTSSQPTRKPNAWPVIQALAASGRCPELRLHGMWDDGHRYVQSRDLPIILREAQRAILLAKQSPKILVRFSPFCEHQIGASELKALFAAIRKIGDSGLFNFGLVNSNWKGAWLPDRDIVNEVHSSHPMPPRGRPFLFSYDGQNCFDENTRADLKTYAKAQTFFFWHPSMNGRMKLDDKTPRPQRKAWPYSQEIDSAIYLSRSDLEAWTLPKGYLFKSHADRHNTPVEPRAGKPVLLCPVDKATIELRTANGQVVERFRYAGSFTGGGFRYYGSEFGYLTAEKARRISGSATVRLFVNGKEVGRGCPALRGGTFR